jgi:hypothetical protein
MTDATTEQNSTADGAFAPRWLLAAGVATLVATAALWIRFGEGVYTQAIINGILACF